MKLTDEEKRLVEGARARGNQVWWQWRRYAFGKQSRRPEPVEVVRETAHKVVVRQEWHRRLSGKSAPNERWRNKTENLFETWEECYAYGLEQARDRLSSARDELESAKASLERIESMVKPEVVE